MKEKTNKKTKAVINAAKRSSIAEHLINIEDCANNYLQSRFRIISHCSNVIDLVRFEAISIFLNKQNCVRKGNLDIRCLCLVY